MEVYYRKFREFLRTRLRMYIDPYVFVTDGRVQETRVFTHSFLHPRFDLILLPITRHTTHHEIQSIKLVVLITSLKGMLHLDFYCLSIDAYFTFSTLITDCCVGQLAFATQHTIDSSTWTAPAQPSIFHCNPSTCVITS